MYRADDGSVGFQLNIKRLRGDVCKSCARTRLAVLLLSTLECGGARGHVIFVSTRMRDTTGQLVFPRADCWAVSIDKLPEFLASRDGVHTDRKSANCGRSALRSIAAIGRCLSANCGRTCYPRRTSHRVPTTTCRLRCSRQASRAARRCPATAPTATVARCIAPASGPAIASLPPRPRLLADSAFRARQDAQRALGVRETNDTKMTSR